MNVDTVSESATASLANYICHSELGSSPMTSPSATAIATEPAQDTITKQLNELTIQFKKGIKNIQNLHSEPERDEPVILKPSFSMPHLPIFSDKLLTENAKFLKKRLRRKPRPLTPSSMVILEDAENDGDCHNAVCFRRHSVATECLPSTSCITPSMSSSHSVSPTQTVPTNPSSSISGSHITAKYHRSSQSPQCSHEEGGHQAINEKLDLLIHLVDSQQKLLHKLVTESQSLRVRGGRTKDSEQSPGSAVQTVALCKGTQTLTVDQSTQTLGPPVPAKVIKPHILQSGAPSAMQSPFTKYPPIPECSSTGMTTNVQHGTASNISVPYDTLMKLMVAATNKQSPAVVATPPPYHEHTPRFGYDPNSMNRANPEFHHRPRDHEIDCNSTLHFSDC